jgi:uncharacterized protein with von Willebrand factor type A (vWA) domain
MDGVARDETFAANLLLFARLLRRAGIAVHHPRVVDAIRALPWLDIGHRQDVQAALAAMLLHRHEDRARFDAAFTLFFREHGASAPTGEPSIAQPPPLQQSARQGEEHAVRLDALAGDAVDEDSDIGAYSQSGVSKTKDFADFSAAELEAARRILFHLPWQLGERRTRRWERRGDTHVDLKRVLRRVAMRGELFHLPFRQRRTRPRPIVFLGDVSGSMERYSRILLHFVYGLARQVRHVESFVFATRLTRLTAHVARRGSDQAMTAVVREVTDWGGGTRIGESLRQFNTNWARRVMRHGPVIVLVSDGWDRGEPDRLAREMARLKRRCHRLIWLNPLLGSADYEPLTRGLQAALPYVDDFLPSHNLVSLEQLARLLGGERGASPRR